MLEVEGLEIDSALDSAEIAIMNLPKAKQTQERRRIGF